MRYLTIISIVVLSLFIAVPAMAFLDDNSGPNADATVEGVAAELNQGDINSGNKYEGTNIWAPAGEIHYPSAPNYLGGAVPGYMQVKISDMFMYFASLEVDEEGNPTSYFVPVGVLKNMQKGSTDDKEIFVNPFIDVSKVKKEDKLTDDMLIKVNFIKAKGAVTPLGNIVVMSDDEGSIAPDVVSAALLEAVDLGAIEVTVIAEGFQRLIRNFGWGVGFATTGAVIGTGGTPMASTSTAGFGYAEGGAGYFDHPYIKLVAIK